MKFLFTSLELLTLREIRRLGQESQKGCADFKSVTSKRQALIKVHNDYNLLSQISQCHGPNKTIFTDVISTVNPRSRFTNKTFCRQKYVLLLWLCACWNILHAGRYDSRHSHHWRSSCKSLASWFEPVFGVNCDGWSQFCLLTDNCNIWYCLLWSIQQFNTDSL